MGLGEKEGNRVMLGINPVTSGCSRPRKPRIAKLRATPLVLAVAIMGVLFAAPAGASAAEWLSIEEGYAPISEPASVGLSGELDVSFPLNFVKTGFECDVDAHATLMPGHEGRIDSASISDCEGVGYYSGCTVGNAAAALPWSMQIAGAEEVSIGEVRFALSSMNPGCPVSNWNVASDPTLDAIANSPEWLASFEVSGPVVVNGGLHISMEAAEWAVTPPGEYAIG